VLWSYFVLRIITHPPPPPKNMMEILQCVCIPTWYRGAIGVVLDILIDKMLNRGHALFSTGLCVSNFQLPIIIMCSSAITIGFLHSLEYSSLGHLQTNITHLTFYPTFSSLSHTVFDNHFSIGCWSGRQKLSVPCA
jgi:hypothetical protein